MGFKPGNPGDPCCGTDCEQLCFEVDGCGVDFPGVSIRVFETGVPGTTLAEGTTDAYGQLCFDLSAHAGKSLSYTATPPDLTDFRTLTEVLIGNWCGRTVRVNMPPATDPGSPAEGGGTVNVLFTKGDGASPWASASVEVFVFLDVIDSGTTDADGRVTLTVPADGSTAYRVRAYRPTDNTPLNSDTFLLQAGECADAHMRMGEVGDPPVNPDLEAVIDVRTCEPSTPGGPKHCCEHCGLETLPDVLYADGIDPSWMYNNRGGWQEVGACDDVPLRFFLNSWIYNPTAGSECIFSVDSPYSDIDPTYGTTLELSCKDDGDGNPAIFLRVRSISYSDQLGPSGGVCVHQAEVEATSVTCDPFAATFDVPSLTSAACPSRDGIFPPMTVVVSETP